MTQSQRLTPIQIFDRPCGTGKTTKILRELDPNKKYLIVVPTLNEVERVIRDASVPFVQPRDDVGYSTKYDHLSVLLKTHKNIVTTHKLYSDIALLARAGCLQDRDIIIDEVLDVCSQVEGVSASSFEEIYLGSGYVSIGRDGSVRPTQKWDEDHASLADTLKTKIYCLASAGMLFWQKPVLLKVLPRDLLVAGRSLKVCTYKAEGSMFVAYLNKLGIPYEIDVDPEEERSFKVLARQLIDVRSISRLDKGSWSYSGQSKGGVAAQVVSSALQQLRRKDLAGVALDCIIITCRKDRWYLEGKSQGAKRRAGPYAKGSRLFEGSHWLANTTRGTNDFSHCSHAIYLYDQHMNPYIRQWLGLDGDREANDRYALSELIQWVYRTRVRKGEPIVLYLPCKRMRRLFTEWLA